MRGIFFNHRIWALLLLLQSNYLEEEHAREGRQHSHRNPKSWDEGDLGPVYSNSL